MNVLSLFSGIGGLELGLERAGMTVVGQVEIDPFCCEVLAKHWPEVPRHDDVRTAVEWWLSEERPRVDVIAGGYPCQPESLAGKRRGTADERWLWPAMARVVHALRPKHVIGENVMGHRTGGLRFVLRDLERLGYATRAGILSAGEVGAPHRRRRIFVIAKLADPERDPGQPWRAGDAAQGQGGRDAGRGGVGSDVADTERERELQPGGPLGAKWRRPCDGGGAGRAVADAGGEGRGARRDSRRDGAQSEAWPDERVEPVGRSRWATEPNVGRVAHGIPNRVDRLRALGNAVVPQVAERIGRLIINNNPEE